MIEALDKSLALAADHGDPAPAVYARLFAEYPEMERLFARDTDGSIKGHMLMEAIEAARDLIGAGAYGAHFIANEWVNHQNLGVPGDIYARFYETMRATFEALLGAHWTPAMDAAWRSVSARADAAIAARA